MTITSSIHIVRQYGRSGGMERYVWELTHALARQDQQVMVVCEKLHEPVGANIEVIELGQVKPKPRWLSMLRFSARVSNFFKGFDSAGWVIHSHERTAVHQVTTFHGPPILSRKNAPWISCHPVCKPGDTWSVGSSVPIMWWLYCPILYW